MLPLRNTPGQIQLTVGDWRRRYSGNEKSADGGPLGCERYAAAYWIVLRCNRARREATRFFNRPSQPEGGKEDVSGAAFALASR